MTCLMSGRTVLTWGLAASCCPEGDADGGPQVKAQCCVFSVANCERQDYVPSTNKVFAPTAGAVDLDPVVSVPPVRQLVAARAMDDRPPPIGVTDRLALLGMLRI